MPKLPALATQVRSLGLPERLVRAIEEVQQFLHIRSTGLDAYISRRDLIEWGFATEPGGGTGGGGGPIAPTLPGGGTPEVPDLTPPPTPTGLTAIGGYSSIFLGWNANTDRRIGYFEIWRASVDDLGQAVKIGQTTGFQYVDSVQNSVTHYYWVRAVNRWDESIKSPFNAVAGTMAQTAPDVPYLIELLEGQLTASELHQSLGERIDLIDAPDTVVGSVSARIAQEAAIRANETGVLAQQVMQLSAGIGEQFDSFKIWYFDAGLEGWGGNGTPVVVDSWVRPANHATDAYLTSPTGLAADAVAYPQVKLRIRRVGAPTWEGLLWWRSTVSEPWSIDGRMSFAEPTFDDDMAVVTLNVPWTGTVDSIRFDLSPAATAFDHYAIDWVAIGRAAPGASVIALQQEASVRASETGALQAQYTVKIDANGYVSGYGLASTASGATPFSEFAVRADAFYIASPSGPGIEPATPFIVRTTPTTINGQPVSVGVYMRSVFIENGAVTNLKIGKLQVDDGHIANLNVGKLLAGTLAVGQYIQSQSYVSGSTGWRINANGTAEFSQVTVRGTVFASAGAIGGIVIQSGVLQSTNYVDGVSGFSLNSDGSAQFNNIVARGTIFATHLVAGASVTSPVITGGSFTGGTFAGGAFFGGSHSAAYAWPASGNGFHLSSAGLLLGNANTGASAQINADGNATFSNIFARGNIEATSLKAGVAMVQTLHIGPWQVTQPMSASGSTSASFVFPHTMQPCVLIAVANATGSAAGASDSMLTLSHWGGSDWVVARTTHAYTAFGSGVTLSLMHALPEGWSNTSVAWRVQFSGSISSPSVVLFALETKR